MDDTNPQDENPTSTNRRATPTTPESPTNAPGADPETESPYDYLRAFDIETEKTSAPPSPSCAPPATDPMSNANATMTAGMHTNDSSTGVPAPIEDADHGAERPPPEPSRSSVVTSASVDEVDAVLRDAGVLPPLTTDAGNELNFSERTSASGAAVIAAKLANDTIPVVNAPLVEDAAALDRGAELLPPEPAPETPASAPDAVSVQQGPPVDEVDAVLRDAGVLPEGPSSPASPTIGTSPGINGIAGMAVPNAPVIAVANDNSNGIQAVTHQSDALASEWGQLVRVLNTDGSDLARWLTTRRLKHIWEDLHPETKHGAAPKPKSGFEIFQERRGRDPKMRSFPAFVDQAAIDTGVSRTSLGRWAKLAEDLTALLGEERIHLLVTQAHRIANNPKGILAKLATLTSRAQAEDVLRIYQEGAGEAKARQALQTYLEVQRERSAAPDDDDDEDEDREPPAEFEVPFTCAVGGHTEVDLDGRTVTISIVAADVGRATGLLRVTCDARELGLAGPCTRSTWIRDVVGALRGLPDVEVHPVEVLLPRFCAHCQGTAFLERPGKLGDGDCIRCRPLPEWPNDARVENELGFPRSERSQYTPQMDVATRLFLEDRKREIITADPRWADGLGYRILHLRSPRLLVRVAAPRGEVPVILWERGSGRSFHGDPTPCIDVGRFQRVVYLNRSDPFHSRWSFRHRVRSIVAIGK